MPGMPLFSTIQLPRTLHLVRSIGLRRAQFRNPRSKHNCLSAAFVRTRRACLKLRSLAYFSSTHTCSIVGLCCDHQGLECPGNLGSTCATSLHIFASLHPTFLGQHEVLQGKENSILPLLHQTTFREFSSSASNVRPLLLQKKYFSCYSGSYQKPPGDALPSNSPMPRYAGLIHSR